LAKDWDTAIWLLSSGAFFWVLTFIGGKIIKPKVSGQQFPQTQVAAVTLKGALNLAFDGKLWFRQAYISPVTDEVEQNIRVIADRNEPTDHEGFLAKFIGVGLVAYWHDSTWLSIYRSQLLMLGELNRRGGYLSITDAKSFYDAAALVFPAIYSKYTYTQWLDFMRLGHQLILQHPSGMLEITVKGKDFLKYLVHWGRYPDARQA
jgi:hypothetical protein